MNWRIMAWLCEMVGHRVVLERDDDGVLCETCERCDWEGLVVAIPFTTKLVKQGQKQSEVG